MRIPLSALLLSAALAASFAPAASAGTTCDDVLGIEGSGQGLVCTVTCVQQYEPSVVPGRDPVVDPGRPGCMDEDAAAASPYCADLGPVPGYGPVCTVRCVLGTDPEVNPKDVAGTLASLVPVCPA